MFYASTDGTCEGENAEVPFISSVPFQGPGCHAYATWEPPLPDTWPTAGTYYEVVGCDEDGFAIPGGSICNEGCSVCQQSASPDPCVDDDVCLQGKPDWGSSYTCADSTQYCDSHTEDMACCPKSCGQCVQHSQCVGQSKEDYPDFSGGIRCGKRSGRSLLGCMTTPWNPPALQESGIPSNRNAEFEACNFWSGATEGWARTCEDFFVSYAGDSDGGKGYCHDSGTTLQVACKGTIPSEGTFLEDLCPVQCPLVTRTTAGDPCVFPFTYQSTVYNSCTTAPPDLNVSCHRLAQIVGQLLLGVFHLYTFHPLYHIR